MPRRPPRPPSASWVEDGPRTWILTAGRLEAYVTQDDDRRWAWRVHAGAPVVAHVRRGGMSLVEQQLAAEDYLHELMDAIARSLGISLG